MKTQKFSVNATLRQSRHDFIKDSLLEQECTSNPFEQFELWLDVALEKDSAYANAMTLCTLDQNNMPDCRTVLLRNISYSGLTFFTNYHSAKGKQIEHNSKGCILFFWKELQRQVKIQGDIRFLPTQESEDYFKSRPFESQVGAWASQQSEVIKDRESMDARYEAELKKFQGKDVPRPEHWGGYVLLPTLFEFWQGRKGRLHDRIRYVHQQNKSWKLERLMP